MSLKIYLNMWKGYDWKNQLYYEVMFYRDAADKSAMDFYWKHEYPFAAGTY